MKRGLIAMAIATAALVAPTVMAQEAPDAGRDAARQRQAGGRNFDPAQMRQRTMDNIREQLKASDEEWQVLQPKVEKLMEAQRNARGGGGGGFAARGARGGRGGDDQQGQQGQTEVARASSELRSALQDENASEAVINERLRAYRAAREKADAALKAAQNELRELVTPRQEAVLVMYGMLE